MDPGAYLQEESSNLMFLSVLRVDRVGERGDFRCHFCRRKRDCTKWDGFGRLFLLLSSAHPSLPKQET